MAKNFTNVVRYKSDSKLRHITVMLLTTKNTEKILKVHRKRKTLHTEEQQFFLMKTCHQKLWISGDVEIHLYVRGEDK